MSLGTHTVCPRHPILNYTSPPVCEVLFSGSGFPVIVLGDFSNLAAPGGVRFGGIGRFRLSWNRYINALCYNIYRAETDDPNAPLLLVYECFDDTSIPLGPGCYRVSAITPDGETQLSPFVCYFVPPMIPPELTTHPASGVTSSQATLNGVINAVGQPSTAQFEWGTTLAYGNFTPLQNTGDTFDDVPFNDLITGLSANTLYHFRAIGSNTSGIGEGADVTFTTLPSGGGGGGFAVSGEYWAYENNLIGSVNGIVMSTGGATFAAGKIGLSARLAGNSPPDTIHEVETVDEPLITNIGTGVTYAGWVKIFDAFGDGILVMRLCQWTWRPNDFSTLGGYIQVDYNRITNTFEASCFDDVASSTITVDVPHPGPNPGDWTLVIAWWDPADMRLRVQVNNGPVFTSAGTLVLLPYIAGAGRVFQYVQAIGSTFFDWFFDETLIHQNVLNSTQRDFLWNGGVGRTYPYL